MVEELADGAVVVELPYAGNAWLIREMLKGAGDIVVIEPEDAREAVLRPSPPDTGPAARPPTPAPGHPEIARIVAPNPGPMTLAGRNQHLPRPGRSPPVIDPGPGRPGASRRRGSSGG